MRSPKVAIMEGSGNKHLRRLPSVFTDHPIYLITICTHKRAAYLANGSVVRVLVEEWRGAPKRHGWHVGRYVVMPDHVHFFCCPGLAEHRSLSQFVGAWKEWISKRLKREGINPVAAWQAEFFDHLIRSGESYAEKWVYVRNNPVRAGLAEQSEEWLYQGVLERIEI
ncbi:MAG: REP-associated tyrosine transposase [Verrucomicrobiales bacterium]